MLTGAYTFGGISGGHFNPAVTLGLAVGKRFPMNEVYRYWAAQVAGAIVAAIVLYIIASGKPGFETGGFAANGYGSHSPGGYGLFSALVCEVVMTAMFVVVIMGATSKLGAVGFAPLAIGLCLTLIHLISIPVTNTSVNPARSIGVSFFAGWWAIGQLWLFILAPLAGGALGGAIWSRLFPETES